MLLSVIVPCYQVEAYIGECLDSLSGLPASQVEVLCVDDCGTDQTRAIAARYCAQYPFMRLIDRTANGGLSAARNTGLAQAQGEYVFFLDSDDLCDAGVLIQIVRAAQTEALDIAKARFDAFSCDGDACEWNAPSPAPTAVMTGDALFALQCRSNTYEPMVWQCLYRRQFLLDHALRMPEGFLFEDELFQTQALLCARRARMFDACLVHYRQRAGSIMKSFHRDARWCAHYLEICRTLAPIARKKTPGARMLRRRVGQIALNVGKNIPAYALEGKVREEAVGFLTRNRRELSGFALSSGSAVVMAQGALLRLSPSLFLSLYARAR